MKRNQEKSKSLSLFSHKVVQESKKPCEVCGSVGIERLTMICFKCRDTREHTYCARVFLPSVPPIWLCEVCRSSSSIVVVPDVAEDQKDLETSLADCLSDLKNSNNSREEDHETEKSRSNDMEEVVYAGISLPVLQVSTSGSNCAISANVSLGIHPPLQPHTSLVAKEASSVPNDSSQDKEPHQVSLAFRKKTGNFRLTGKHLSQPHQSLISSRESVLNRNASLECETKNLIWYRRNDE